MTRVKSTKQPKKADISDFNEALSKVIEKTYNEIKKTAEKAGMDVDVIIQVIPKTTKEGVTHGG